MNARSQSRSAARLAAVQALYQQEMEGTPTAKLIHEFHEHRLGATIEDVTYAEAEVLFFDDIVAGVLARKDEIDGKIEAKLAEGWSLKRLDRPMRALLRAGTGDRRISRCRRRLLRQEGKGLRQRLARRHRRRGSLLTA